MPCNLRHFPLFSSMSICNLQVLDELLSVLHTVANTSIQPRAHELLQELRDISSMAMEHFDEKITPGLKSLMPSAIACGGGPAFVSPGQC